MRTMEGRVWVWSSHCASRQRGGRRDFEVIDPDGSFTITGKVHFAYVIVKGNAADATWNRDPKSFHAELPLGTLTRTGACWENATAQICAHTLPNK